MPQLLSGTCTSSVPSPCLKKMLWGTTLRKDSKKSLAVSSKSCLKQKPQPHIKWSCRLCVYHSSPQPCLKPLSDQPPQELLSIYAELTPLICRLVPLGGAGKVPFPQCPPWRLLALSSVRGSFGGRTGLRLAVESFMSFAVGFHL